MPPDEIRSPAAAEPAEPWRSFLRDLDQGLRGSIELRCLGGFVVTQHYGIGRETSDIDFLTVIAQSPEDDIERLAGLGSELHRKYGLYMQHVGIATPSDYVTRLTRMSPSAAWKRLNLLALDAIDLGLSKLERNSDRERDDVLRLARAGHLDRDVLKARYLGELHPYLLGKLPWHDRLSNSGLRWLGHPHHPNRSASSRFLAGSNVRSRAGWASTATGRSWPVGDSDYLRCS